MNETPQGFHASRREKSRLYARSFRVTYCEGLVEAVELMERDRGVRDGKNQGSREVREAEIGGSGSRCHTPQADAANEERILD